MTSPMLIGMLALQALVFSSDVAARTVILASPDKEDQATAAFIQTFQRSPVLAEADLSVSVMTYGSLGKPSDIVDMVLASKIGLALVSMSTIESIPSNEPLQYAALISQPLLISDPKEQFSVQDSVFGDLVAAELGKRKLVSLAFWNRTPSQIFTKHRIAKISDLYGMKLHTYDTSAANVMRAFGAEARQGAPGEAGILALQRGVVDGAELFDRPSMALLKFFRGGSALKNFRSSVGVLVIGEALWSELLQPQRNALQRAAKQAELQTRETIQAANQQVTEAAAANDIRQISFDALVGSAAVKRAAREQWLSSKGSAGVQALELLEQLQRSSLPRERDKRGDAPREEIRPSIYFATDRNDEGHPELTLRFGIRRTSQLIHCGRLDFVDDPQRPLGHRYSGPLTSSGSVLQGNACIGLLADAAAQSNGNLVFMIPGYWNSFESALRRAVAVAVDLGIKEPLVVWSWPSGNAASNYHYDEESVEWSRPHFQWLLKSITDLPIVKAVDLVGHSMGGRLTIVGLETLRPSVLRYVVFVAPDVATTIFKQRLQLNPRAGNLRTLYASARDRALRISALMHQESRAGMSGADIIVMDGLETIDATPVERMLSTNHYHAYEVPEAVSDLRKLITNHLPAKDRSLDEAQKAGVPYWLIKPAAN